MKTLKFNLLLIISLALMACNRNPPQYPTIYSNDGFLDYSKEFNKQVRELENEQILDYMQSHKEDFLQTNAGFYMTRTNLDNQRLVKDLDTIAFEYQISNLKDSIIYNYKDIGKQTIVLGRASLMPGIEYGLKRMTEGDAAKLLIPSSLAYGVNGDQDKIGADQPLVIHIKLLDILNYDK